MLVTPDKYAPAKPVKRNVAPQNARSSPYASQLPSPKHSPSPRSSRMGEASQAEDANVVQGMSPEDISSQQIEAGTDEVDDGSPAETFMPESPETMPESEPSDAAAAGQQVDPGQQHLGEDDITSQAVDILAGLTSLGISQALRAKVQEALDQLDRASASAASAVPELQGMMAGAVSPARRNADAKRPPATGDKSSRRAVEELEKKLQMSRSIMRKLYHKNVDLEKEVQVLKANSSPVASLDMLGSLSPVPAKASSSSRPATSAGPLTPMAQAMQERDDTIKTLQHALDAARRRCALLESQGPAATADGSKQQQQQEQGIREVLAQSALHLSKYTGIRDDYNRLLKKRTNAVSSSKAASQEARALVEEMQNRLSKEIQEREAEAALYSAKLYESERQMSDWYVEKRMLEQHIEKLTDEVSQRDRMDSEMETCVCGLFEKLRLLEEANVQLTAKLEAAGLSGKQQEQQGAAQVEVLE